ESDEQIPPEEEHRAFTNKPLLVRMAIVAAGPVSNYLMAMVLICVAFGAGWLAGPTNIGKVFKDTPAMDAGLRAGDKVLAVDGKPVTRWDAMRRIIEKNPGKTLSFTVQRGEEKLDLKVTPRASKLENVAGRSVGRIGVMPIRLGFFASAYEGVRFTVHLTGLILETLVKLARMQVSAKELAGPITIAQASGESLKAGLFSFIFLMAFISINLAIINLLPIPILDGGHLMFFAIEAVIRRPVTGKVREIATHAGLLFLVLLMVLVFYNDINRIMTQGWSLKP
ncbi:MAG: RIP metalloprotease RseP, partial [Deltaproteobacteria bacterium]